MRTCALLLLLAAVRAEADAVEVSVTSRAQMGKGLPMVHLYIHEPIAGFRLKLKRSDGREFDVKGGGRPGQTRDVELDQPEGPFSYQGELTVSFPNASTAEMPLEFKTELWGPLRMTLEKNDVDVPKRRLTFRLNRPAAKAHLTVMMDTGKNAFDSDLPFQLEPPGTPLVVSWPEAPGVVMKISLKAYDASTFFTGVDVYPWQVDIPHEEVNFDSGKWEVRPVEAPKLEKSLELIFAAIEKYGSLAQIKLFIAGHTDTVGSADSNRILSLNRAKAIGGYFRKRGLKIPVMYEGFGEEAQRVATPDETAEEQNRRAEYIIAVENPGVQNTPFVPRWQKL